MRRAFHDAASPPAGPVFVSLPMSMLDEEGDLPVPPPSEIERRAVPSALDELADLLTEPAGRVAGDRRRRRGRGLGRRARARRPGRGARRARVRRAAALDRGRSRPRTRCTPGCWRRRRPRSAPTLAPYRRVLAVGGHAFMVYPYTPGSAAARHGRAAAPLARRRSSSAAPIRRRLGLVGDPKASLAALLPLVAVGRHRRRGGRRRSRAQRRERGRRDRRARGDRASRYTTRADGSDGGGPRARAGAAPGHHGRRRGHHHRRLRPRLPPLDRAGPLLLLQGRRARLGHARGARRLARPRPRARALRRRRRVGHVLARRRCGRRRTSSCPSCSRSSTTAQYLILKGYLRGMGRDSVRGRSLRRDGHRRAAGRLRRPRAVDGRRRHARREGRRRRRRRVAAALESGRPHLLELPIAARDRRGDASPSICAASASCTTASSRSTASTGECSARRALGRARPQRLGQDDAPPHRLAVPAPDHAAT